MTTLLTCCRVGPREPRGCLCLHETHLRVVPPEVLPLHGPLGGVGPAESLLLQDGHLPPEVGHQLHPDLVVEEDVEDEDGEALEGVGEGEDHAQPAERLVEIEEAGEPGETEDGDEREAALQLGHHLLAPLQVVVPADGHPGHAHGEQEDDDVDGDDDGHGPHEGPDEAVCVGEPAVLTGAVALQVHHLVTEERQAHCQGDISTILIGPELQC